MILNYKFPKDTVLKGFRSFLSSDCRNLKPRNDIVWYGQSVKLESLLFFLNLLKIYMFRLFFIPYLTVNHHGVPQWQGIFSDADQYFLKVSFKKCEEKFLF